MADIGTLEARLALTRKYSAKYGLDPCLVAAVADHESSWNPWAMRYEPLFFARYIQPLVNAGTVRTMTEAMGRSTSYGLMQIMGQVAREFGFAGKFLTELCDPDVGMEYGCKKLKHCMEAMGNVREALLAYNGGGCKEYPDLVMPLTAKYQGDQP